MTKRLSFAAGEDGAAVGAGQDAGFDPDVANFVEGAGIGTAFLLDHFLAEDAFAQRFVILSSAWPALFRRLREFRLAASS